MFSSWNKALFFKDSQCYYIGEKRDNPVPKYFY